MKQKVYYFLGIIILVFFTMGCTKNKLNEFDSKEPNTTRVMQTIYDPTDKIKSYIFEIYDIDSKLIKICYYASDKKLIRYSEMEYDKDSVLRCQKDFNKKGQLQRDSQLEFDNKGRILWKHFYTESHELDYSFRYLYDEEGKLTQHKVVYPEGIISESSYYTLYEYNSDGTLKSEDSYEGIGETEITSSIQYIYENGVLVRKEWYNYIGDTCTEYQSTDYTYDDQNRLYSIYCYKDDELTEYTLYSYD